MPSIQGPGEEATGSPAGERRRQRSDDPIEALSCLFEAARSRLALDTVVLADPTGLTLAGGGSAARCDDLAARAAVSWGQRPANDTIPCRLDVVTRTARIRRLSIDGIELLLCGEGVRSPDETALASVLEGCRRILGDRAPFRRG